MKRYKLTAAELDFQISGAVAQIVGFHLKVAESLGCGCARVRRDLSADKCPEFIMSWDFPGIIEAFHLAWKFDYDHYEMIDGKKAHRPLTMRLYINDNVTPTGADEITLAVQNAFMFCDEGSKEAKEKYKDTKIRGKILD